jgi:hypothetical protein
MPFTFGFGAGQAFGVRVAGFSHARSPAKQLQAQDQRGTASPFRRGRSGPNASIQEAGCSLRASFAFIASFSARSTASDINRSPIISLRWSLGSMLHLHAEAERDERRPKLICEGLGCGCICCSRVHCDLCRRHSIKEANARGSACVVRLDYAVSKVVDVYLKVIGGACSATRSD